VDKVVFFKHPAKPMKDLNFFFDFLSPFSYFAWTKLELLKKEKSLNVHYYPVALGPILNHWGIKGPGEVEPKREYLLKQCLRYAHQNRLEFTTPKTHPFNSLYALRLALKGVAGDLQPQVIGALWKAGWQKRIDMAEPEELLAALRAEGLPADELYEKSFLKEAKVELKQNIQAALSKGVFGVPAMVVRDELFWGADSLPDLMSYIEGQDALDRQKLKELLSSTPRGASQSL
jgi:2-hydroxychromene-2-carboxylate isomerase